MNVQIDFMILANKQKKMTESLNFITTKRQPGTSEVTKVKVQLMFVYNRILGVSNITCMVEVLGRNNSVVKVCIG